MKITVELSYEEVKLIQMGICFGYNHAKAGASASRKTDPLEHYKTKSIADQYRALNKKITAELDKEMRKFVDSRKNGGV